ncbi:hypothetical protein BV25DRAFT_190212 [Artomyces pyxidatus]|uniref:Uncharacterized protein n=1 Tax=Artomyces pyxidatus TaxID=48021 RepID=A0ACB8T8P8_9AGAM|nr:hypothetical protein BV25DRAFT_190212 [Artomyces pyxidatus]
MKQVSLLSLRQHRPHISLALWLCAMIWVAVAVFIQSFEWRSPGTSLWSFYGRLPTHRFI